jgi:hypothetical protein
MTYALCFVCQDKPFAQRADTLREVESALVTAWNQAASTQLRLGRLRQCAAVRPPHTADALATRYALGPSAVPVIEAVLGPLAIFQPDMHGDRLLAHSRRDGWRLSEQGREVACSFVEAFHRIYPWGRVGLWLADMSGSTQSSALHGVEAASLTDLVDGRLEPNAVKLLRGQPAVS